MIAGRVGSLMIRSLGSGGASTVSFSSAFPGARGRAAGAPGDEFVSTLYVPRERKEEVVLAEYESPSASPGTTWFGGSSVWEALASAVEDDVEKSGRRETHYWENYDITVSLRPDLVDARECVRVPHPTREEEGLSGASTGIGRRSRSELRREFFSREGSWLARASKSTWTSWSGRSIRSSGRGVGTAVA